MVELLSRAGRMLAIHEPLPKSYNEVRSSRQWIVSLGALRHQLRDRPHDCDGLATHRPALFGRGLSGVEHKEFAGHVCKLDQPKCVHAASYGVSDIQWARILVLVRRCTLISGDWTCS